MNKKNLLLLFVFVILGTASYLAVKKPWQKQESPFVFPGLSSQKITKIEVQSSGDSFTLEKRNSSWVLLADGVLPADSKKVENFLDKLKKLKKINLASVNPERVSFYEVDKKKGIQVKLWNGNDLVAQFTVGKNGPSFVGSYLRKGDSSSIYLVDEVVRLEKNDFKDRKIAQIPQNKITGLLWEYPQNSFQILKKDNQWQWSKGGKEVEAEKVKEVTGLFSNFLAKDVFDASVRKMDWGKADLTLTVQQQDKKDQFKIIIQKEDNNERYFIRPSEEEGVVYELYEYQAKKLLKKKKDFQ